MKPRLSEEEQAPLFLRVQRHDDRAALSQLVKMHLGLVNAVAHPIGQHFGLDHHQDDLFQQGSLGLLSAIRRFDPHRGFKFSTYAAWWIRQSVLAYVAQNSGTLRPCKAIFFVVRRVQGELAAHGLDPTPERITERLGGRRRVAQHCAALQPAGELHDDLVQEDGEAARLVARRVLCWVLTFATEREQFLVKGLLAGQSREEIAASLGVSRERVRQVQEALFARARHAHNRPSRARLRAATAQPAPSGAS